MIQTFSSLFIKIHIFHKCTRFPISFLDSAVLVGHRTKSIEKTIFVLTDVIIPICVNDPNVSILIRRIRVYSFLYFICIFYCVIYSSTIVKYLIFKEDISSWAGWEWSKFITVCSGFFCNWEIWTEIALHPIIKFLKWKWTKLLPFLAKYRRNVTVCRFCIEQIF